MADIQLCPILSIKDTSTAFLIGSIVADSTKWNSPKSRDKFRILWNYESPFKLNSYGPFFFKPPVGDK